MARAKKPVKTKAAAKRPAARKPAQKPRAKSSVAQRLEEALEQQAATSEILRVISSARADAQPVFDTIAANALRLCEAMFSVVYRFDGQLIHIAAFENVSRQGAAAFHKAYPCNPSRGGATQRAVLERSIVHIPDVRDDPEYVYLDAADKANYRSVLAVPMLRAGRPIGAISVFRGVARPFPESQVELLRTFADQAVIAIENVRLFTALEARNADLTEALEQKTATGEVLRVIASSPNDTLPVFDLLAQRAGRLCNAEVAVVSRFDGGLIELAAIDGVVPEGVKIVRGLYPMDINSETVTARTIRGSTVVHMADVLADPSYAIKDFALAARYRAGLGVPIVRDGTVIGSIFVGRTAPGLYTDSQVELLKTFADQAIIAIENVRLFTELQARNSELTESLEQQTATSKILRVISQSPTDTQPVFDTIAAAALKLCNATSANVFSFDGKQVHLAALVNVIPGGADSVRRSYPRPIGRDNAASRAVLTGKIIAVPDVLEDTEYGIGVTAASAGFRSVLAVPLLREGNPIGAIAVGRAEPGSLPDAQVALLQTFADQAVIAIENVRLFTELAERNSDLTEALDQQTATSEILRVISQSQSDVQPVFDTIAAAAVGLCGAHSALVFTFDGELIHLAAIVQKDSGTAEAIRQRFPRPPSRDTAITRAIQTQSMVAIPDVLEDREYVIGAHSLSGGFRSVLAVPLIRDGKAIGGITLGRAEPGPFLDMQVELLKTFADQAVIAIENVRLFTELQSRNADLTEALEQQTATSDILRVISQSQTDVQPVFDTIVAAAMKLCGAVSANVFTFDGKLVRVAAVANPNPKYIEALQEFFPRPPSRETAVLRAILTGTIVAVPDVMEDSEYAIGGHSVSGGFRSVLAVPLLREGRPIGGIAVGRPASGPFPDEQVSLLQTFADQAVIAIENVRLFTELAERNSDLTEALDQQTATSDILRVISRSQIDAQPVFEAIAAAALNLCRANLANVFTYDGEMIHLSAVANTKVDPEYLAAIQAAFPRPPGRDTCAGRTVLTRTVVAIPNVTEDREYRISAQTLSGGFHSVLGVPLMRDGTAIGTIVVGRLESGSFADDQVALLKTFADQAVIAIENVRLFTELQSRNADLTEALEQQTATSDILSAISQSQTDVQPVFDTIVAHALKLCGASSVTLITFDGELIASDGNRDSEHRRRAMRCASSSPGRLAARRPPHVPC